jgi:hypothetical protein
MGFFGGKKKEKKEVKRDKYADYIEEIKRRRGIHVPVKSADYEKKLYSREYRIYKKGEKRKPGWYEKLAKLALKSGLKVTPDKESSEKIEKAAAFTGMDVTPAGVMSLFVLTIIAFFILGFVVIIISLLLPAAEGIERSIISVVLPGFVVAFMGVPIGYYLYTYPNEQVKVMRIQASSQVVLAVLYMVVSMRVSHNLENALKFTAANVSGALAWDMRKLLWDIQMGKYYSADEAISDYISKWKVENEEFAEALRLVKESTHQTPERARAVLDEALTTVLEGSKTRMKHYAQELKLPVMVIHMMGIILPVMGTIMAPLAAVFMSDVVRPEHFIIGYDIILPVVIIWFINNTLKKRPVTVSQVDITNHPNLPPKGTFMLGKTRLPALPIGILITAAIVAYPLFFFATQPELLLSGMGNHTPISMLMSLLLIVGFGVGASIYWIISNSQAVKIQKEVESIESEFELALFQLGNRISGGTPTEVAVERSIDDVKDLKICNLFRLTLRNIRSLGMTFEEALFNPKYGSLKYYPSKLIENIMYAVTDTAKKGISYASEGMLRIANYMKNIRETQEYIRDLLSETVSSMRFQAYFLTPLITGLIVSMAEIIVKVLTKLGEYLDSVNLGQDFGLGDFSGAFGNMETSVAPEMFQIIIGVYLLEVIIILGMFLSRIERGDSKATQWYSTGMMLVVAVVIYFIVAMVSITMFGDLITSALSTLGIS